MLLDTSGLLSLQYSSEPHHSQALLAYKRAKGFLIHSYILSEYVALTNARRFPRLSSLAFLSDITTSPEVKVVWVNEALHLLAIDFLRARADKSYSLCDAVSFELMRQHKIVEALTTDRHFEQAGFIRLLKDS